MGKEVSTIFIDTNVLVDLLSGRRPYAYEAADLFQLIVEKKCEGIVSSLTLLNTHYLLKKFMKEDRIRIHLEEIISLVAVAPVGADELFSALRSGWPDFEDAVQYFTSLAAHATAIVTRNSKDFLKSSIPVLTPVAFTDKFKS
jgi:predicted nucleic acid-binding protein